MSDSQSLANAIDVDFIVASAQSSQQVLSKEGLANVVDATWSEKEAAILKAWLDCPYLPDEALESLSKLITTSIDHSATVAFLQETILGALKSTGGKTAPVTPISAQERRSLDEVSTKSSPKTHRRNFHLDLLRRDGGKDQILGWYSWDIESMQKIPSYMKDLGLEGVELTNKNTTQTKGAHIFPHKLGEYTMAQTRAARAKEKRIHEFWQAIYFMFPSIEARIGCNTIDTLSNGITMAEAFYSLFGAFDFGLKHLNDDLYEAVLFKRFPDFLGKLFKQDDQGRHIVQFTYRSGCPDGEKVDRHLLALHLTFAHVMNTTDVGELIEWEDYEEADLVVEDVHGPYRLDPRFTGQLHARLLSFLNTIS